MKEVESMTSVYCNLNHQKLQIRGGNFGTIKSYKSEVEYYYYPAALTFPAIAKGIDIGPDLMPKPIQTWTCL